MKTTDEILGEMFQGDEKLAKEILLDIEKIKISTEHISKMLSENLSITQSKRMTRALAESYGELVSGVILPIKYKFPNIDKN